jgi:hypothetical protein
VHPRYARAIEFARQLHQRLPWLLPLASFAFGWISFFLVQRGEHLARVIAIVALLGLPWLLAENLLGRWLVTRSQGRLSIGAVRFITQQIQQEILFFALPFLLSATQFDAGQILFGAGAVAAAVLTTIDPLYLHRLAPHPGLSSAFHAYCIFIAALVVLPIALHLPLDQALPLAMGVTALTLFASLPRMLLATASARMRGFGVLALAIAFFLLWALRSWIPPAGLWVREARITPWVKERLPGPALDEIDIARLQAQGLVAYVAVRAPLGLEQAVFFEWTQDGELIDRIPAEIDGGREAGFRTYSRKLNFPKEPRGRWQVELRTPQDQLIARLGFVVN